MPMYEYRCRDCGQSFEEIRGVNELDEGALCPTCGGGAEKLFSSFATATGGGAASAGGTSCGPRGFS